MEQSVTPVIRDKLSWDQIRAFPVKSKEMSVVQLRQLCVDFFRFTKTFLWTPDDDFHYIRNAKGSEDHMYRGQIYGGLPYIGLGTGNVYRLMDYYDPETGVVDIKAAAKELKLFGNQCSIGSSWGWARVISSAAYTGTPEMVQANGFLRLGPYTYDDSLADFKISGVTTTQIIAQNGEDVIFESYACLQPADGLVYYRTAGHVIMCSAAPHVVRNADGTINPEESYVTIIEQAQRWVEMTSTSGDSFLAKNSVDKNMTFRKLVEEAYIPFTYGEFQGTYPIEDTWCEFSHRGDSVTAAQLKAASVTSNFYIADVYAELLDNEGNVTFREACRCRLTGRKLLELDEAIHPEAWEPYADGKHTVRILVQLGTGERPCVYQGMLVKA